MEENIRQKAQMKSFKQFNEDILDDLLGDFKTDTPAKTVKSRPKAIQRKSTKQKAKVFKGKKPEGYAEYSYEGKNLKSIINMFAMDNIKLYDSVQPQIAIKDLDTIKEYDRKVIDGFTGSNTDKEVNKLKDSIKKSGIKQWGVVTITRLKNGNVTAVLTEGNHRLMIAKELNIKTMPIMFYYN